MSLLRQELKGIEDFYPYKWSLSNEIQARRASEGIQILETRNDYSTVRRVKATGEGIGR